MATKRTKTEQLWHSTDEEDWRSALAEYDKYILNAEVRRLDQELEALDLGTVRDMNEQEWFDWLHDRYFPWKYSAPNRLATTRGSLNRSVLLNGSVQENGLRDIFVSVRGLSESAESVVGFGVAWQESVVIPYPAPDR